MKFVIFLEKKATEEEAFRNAVADHVAYLQQLHEQGILVAGGPFRDGEGGMILIDVASEADASAVASADPFVTSGARGYSLKSWEVLTAVRPELLTRDG